MDIITEKLVPIGTKTFVRGSIKRLKYKNNNRQYLYNYHDVKADFLNSNNFCKDYWIELLYKKGNILKKNKKAYYIQLRLYLTNMMENMEITEEEMYSDILKLRSDFLNVGQITSSEIYSKVKMNRKSINGINQERLMTEKMASYHGIYILVEEKKYSEIVTDYYLNLKKQNINVTIIVKENNIYHDSITALELIKSSNETISNDDIKIITDQNIGVDFKNVFVEENSAAICFGEWFLGANKGLNIDSYVYCTSEEIITREACNTSDKEEIHFIYIPKDYNLIDQLETIEISFSNYRILSWIHEKLGDKVYLYNFEQLLEKYPNYFINYKSDQVIDYIPMDYKGDFYKDRIDSVIKYTQNHISGLRLIHKECRDKHGQIMRVVGMTIDDELQKKIVVKNFNQATNIRKYFREKHVVNKLKSLDENDLNITKNTKIGIVSNFLFFSTDISMASYNTLREERPKEQYSEYGWHLDYRCEKSFETVPVFNKACISLTNSGDIVFNKKRLEDGEFIVNDFKVQVSSNIINLKSDSEEDVIIYTPMLCTSEEEDFRQFKMTVGEGRTNVVFINNDIVCVRNGDVLLPNAGIILSFKNNIALKILDGLICDDHGYFNCEKISCSYRSENVMKNLWSYGGGMFLIEDKIAASSEDELMNRFRDEGWLNDLSKQTQGSLTYKNSKHPRTAIGKTSEGKFFVFVCTGRSKYSVGADYLDLITIAKDLYGDVEYLMNVDGGASSFIGVTIDGEVIPLTDITYTDDSAAGEIRALNSILSMEV